MTAVDCVRPSFVARSNKHMSPSKQCALFNRIFAPLREHAKESTLLAANPLHKSRYKHDLANFRKFWKDIPQSRMQEAYCAEEYNVQAADGAVLSTFCFRHKLATPETRTILLFNPNSATSAELPYHWLIEEAASHSIPCNFVAFDYRTTGCSTGDLQYASDFLIDADAMLQFIEEKFETGRNLISLYGWSLGGAIAANAAYLQPGSMAPIILERTFSTSSKVVFKGLDILQKVGQFFLSLILRIIQWELETVAPTKTMLDEGRPVMIIHHPLDPVMQNAASLYESVKGHPSLIAMSLGDENEEPAPWVNHHLAPLNWYSIGETETAAKIALDFLLR